MSVDTIARVLYDAEGHPVAVSLDGSIYKLETFSKVRRSDGTVVNPATEDTLALVKAKTDNIPSDPAKESGKLTTIDGHLDANLSTRATEATLLVADGRLTTIDSVLDSIKDTAGIKKITDQLPAGTNEIGKVAQGTKAAGSAAWPQVLYDSSGNVVGVVLDGSVYRIQADSKVAKGGSALVHLDAIDTISGKGRLKATLYTQDGDAVTFGSVPPNPESIRNTFVKNGSNESLLVDGSSTPVVFSYDADATHDISLQELKFVVSANGITFGTNKFGVVSALANGLLIEITSGGNTGTVANLVANECFVHLASPGGFMWVVSSKDMMASAYSLGGGLRLRAGTADKVMITVRDNLSSAATYFKCCVKGNLLEIA